MIEPFRGSVVLFAVEREAKAFVRTYRERHVRAGDYWICGDEVLVGLLGVGKPFARKRLEALLASGCRPARIIVAGFAGALRTGMPLAEVVVATEVVDEHGGRWATTWPEKRTGRVLTCDQMIGEPARKLELGIRHDAEVVEMESSAVAEICQKRGIAFGCVRVVSDDVNKPLSKRLMGLVESGRVSIPRVLWETIRSPKMAVELIRLAKQTRRAADSLAETLRSLLAITVHVEP